MQIKKARLMLVGGRCNNRQSHSVESFKSPSQIYAQRYVLQKHKTDNGFSRTRPATNYVQWRRRKLQRRLHKAQRNTVWLILAIFFENCGFLDYFRSIWRLTRINKVKLFLLKFYFNSTTLHFSKRFTNNHMYVDIILALIHCDS